jgi:hypothetical protein
LPVARVEQARDLQILGKEGNALLGVDHTIKAGIDRSGSGAP